MYLICLIHAIGYVDSRWTHPLANVSFAGVLGFVLISGYYGIRFSWLKVFKLESTAFYCAAFVTIIGEALTSHTLTHSNFQTVISIWKGYWFIHAYVEMMVLAAVLDVAHRKGDPEDAADRRLLLKRALPFIVMVYGWAFLMLIPGVQSYIPRSSGLESYSGVTLFAAYLVGRLYRAYDLDRLSQWLIYPLAVVGACLAAFSGKGGLNWGGALAKYNTPTLLALAFGLFYFFRHMGLRACQSSQTLKLLNSQTFKPSNFQTFLNVLLPSVLPIYLLHCNPYGYKALAWLESRLMSCGLPSVGGLNFFFVASIVFVSCLLLDMPRRILSKIFYRCLGMSQK